MLAACSGGGFFGEREPWRKEAEARCIGSGAVREGPGVVRISAINGPGMCGADFPFHVSSLGVPAALSFGDDLRPPASIPNAPRAAPPRWPIAEPPDGAAATSRAARRGRKSIRGRCRRRAVRRRSTPQRYDEPMSLDPPQRVRAAARASMISAGPTARRPTPRAGAQPSRAPIVLRSSACARARVARRRSARRARRASPAATGTVTVTPNATLACPLVSALDQWIATSVQPSAMRWFGQPVVEIKQISAYSCRGMNGNPRARISEHAFGNALDIASFTLADGRRVTVRDGWRGAPEEQGFLRDVQASACDRFTTVLAPGSNVFHYDHMHVDLMRRSGGYRACNPRAVSGEEVAARARATYARQGRDPGVTGSVDPRRKRAAEAPAADRLRRGQGRPSAAARHPRRGRRGLVHGHPISKSVRIRRSGRAKVVNQI